SRASARSPSPSGSRPGSSARAWVSRWPWAFWAASCPRCARPGCPSRPPCARAESRGGRHPSPDNLEDALSKDAPSNPPLTLRLHAGDSVVIARAELAPGTNLPGEATTVHDTIPLGHKVATRAIATGEPVRRYGQIIGFATRDIAKGEHVHTQNLAMGEF